jgi:dipeptidyl aminopeptidase/acylaminoacyl peptidase
MRLSLVFVLGVAAASAAAQTGRRPLRVSDLYQVRDIEDPQRSPDGQWVAYAVTQADSTTDKNHTDVWMVRWDGLQTIQLTSGTDGASSPRWSPDGRYIGFLSSRGDSDETTQLWLLNRAGGEGMKVTQFTGDVEDYAWSPDGTKIVLAVTDEPEDSTEKDKAAKAKKPKPIVIDRYQFKQDIVGYMGKKRTHLYLFDVDSHHSEVLTPGQYDEEGPVWSPDGTRIAFVSKRFPTDVDRADNWDVFVMDAKPNAPAKQLTTSPGQDNPPERGHVAWSPDGSLIAYVRGSPDPKLYAYDQFELATVPAAGGEPRVVSGAIDRPVADPRWSKDGKSITVVVTDDRSQYPASIDVASGQVTRHAIGPLVVSDATLGSDGAVTALVTTDSQPPEVVAIESGIIRRLTHANDAWLTGVELSAAEEFSSRSKDGTDVHGLVIKPIGYVAGRKYPTLLRIHGGPEGQDQHEFSFERQLFAANGYVVVEANYRGSNGRGEAYEKAIMADWGHKEVIDLLGAVDHVVAMGLADTARLGIGGWSYGGILTDYTIASDHRFKAATSGAGSALQLAMYGVDEYITQYTAELGQPWEHPELWIKVSYAFFHANRITTPTLFLGGDQDFNVPVIGGEQMYQALRSLGVPSELVIYPGQFHGLTRPSFRTDRWQRYLDWYATYLKPGSVATAATH